MFCSLPVELRSHFDLLASRKEIGNGDTGDTRHLSQIEKTAEFLEKSERQVCVLEAIYCESPSREFVLGLQLRDYRVVHILLLLAQEVSRNRIQRVRTQLMFSQDDLEHIELYTTLYIDVLGFACPQGFARKSVVLDAGIGVQDATKHRILVHMQGHRPIDNVGEVKVHYVVSCYDIRVHLYKEISPSLKELLLTLE